MVDSSNISANPSNNFSFELVGSSEVNKQKMSDSQHFANNQLANSHVNAFDPSQNQQ